MPWPIYKHRRLAAYFIVSLEISNNRVDRHLRLTPAHQLNFFLRVVSIVKIHTNRNVVEWYSHFLVSLGVVSILTWLISCVVCSFLVCRRKKAIWRWKPFFEISSLFRALNNFLFFVLSLSDLVLTLISIFCHSSHTVTNLTRVEDGSKSVDCC